MVKGDYTFESTPRDNYRILVVAEESCLSVINEMVMDAILACPGLIDRIQRHEARGFLDPSDIAKYDYIFISKKKAGEMLQTIIPTENKLFLVDINEYSHLNILVKKKIIRQMSSKFDKAC